MKKMCYADFIGAVQELRKREKQNGGSLYDMAVNLVNKGYKTEAYILILATWNVGHAKFAGGKLNIEEFEKKITGLQRHLDKLDKETIGSIDFATYERQIKRIYRVLAGIEVIKYTGASKVMHLMNPKVFVMWDNYIRGRKGKRNFQRLSIVKNKYRLWKRYGNNDQSYLQFLKDMQELFGHLCPRYSKSRYSYRTFAKAIDEYNYSNITRPLKKMERKEKSGRARKEGNARI
jgi:hypothetical protein